MKTSFFRTPRSALRAASLLIKVFLIRKPCSWGSAGSATSSTPPGHSINARRPLLNDISPAVAGAWNGCRLVRLWINGLNPHLLHGIYPAEDTGRPLVPRGGWTG